jgi:copper chaperone CopZ
MKALLAVFAIFVLFLSSAHAGEVSYVAGLTGIECADCKKKIAQSLGKLKGVKTIRITKMADDKHSLTIVTDGTVAISKDDAVKALGDESHYVIVSWNKAG